MVDFIQVDCFTSQLNYSRLLAGTFLDRHAPYLLYSPLKSILSTKHILTQMKFSHQPQKFLYIFFFSTRPSQICTYSSLKVHLRKHFPSIKLQFINLHSPQIVPTCPLAIIYSDRKTSEASHLAALSILHRPHNKNSLKFHPNTINKILVFFFLKYYMSVSFLFNNSEIFNCLLSRTISFFLGFFFFSPGVEKALLLGSCALKVSARSPIFLT